MKKLIGLLAVMCISSTAFGGVMLEPLLGYEMGTTKATTAGGDNNSGKTTGVMYGLRAGYMTFSGLWLAAEYNGDTGAKFKFDAGGPGFNTSTNTLGATVGFDSMFGFRFYASYDFSYTSKLTMDGSEAKYTGGTAYKLGIGYKLHMLPLAFGLEYAAAKPDKYSTGGQTINMNAVYSKYNTSSINLVVSAPFDLL